ncbi:MAG: nickel-dependent hydrogenase large subunit [Motiliproteus sp.]|nr:nickel-dependent hydrogenase large subunit [Motiliproteus sp.]MCW9051281.1 nickel-dependent hydrogenase large subunit [Motiliproteus sp.]
MTRLVVGPFNRVEGDLEVKLDISQQQVQQAWVNCTLYRGFEQILRGKRPEDAMVYTPRICGICSVSQSVAALRALADVQGIKMPVNGQRVTNLVLANENMADHFSHFYLFFMPDFARPIYRDRPWFDKVERRFKAVTGTATAEIVPARAEFLHLMGTLAGKWPHTLTLQPGGVSKSVQPQERLRVLAILQGFRAFLERVTIGDRLENFVALDSLEALQSWAAANSIESDLTLFLEISEDLQLQQLGQAGDLFMSYGNYPLNGEYCLHPGLWQQGKKPLDLSLISEDISHSWMNQSQAQLPPISGETEPDMSNPAGYSWCKAPRLDGKMVEVGAFARQLVDGHPLARALYQDSRSNVRNRVLMRLLELARITIAMEQWAREIDPSQPFFEDNGQLMQDGIGIGTLEAARGSLGHWLEVRDGKIHNYQIIAPTTWNFSPRDSQQQPGALELALQGAPVREGEKEPVAVQHIVRSFDPCMVCTVH